GKGRAAPAVVRLTQRQARRVGTAGGGRRWPVGPPSLHANRVLRQEEHGVCPDMPPWPTKWQSSFSAVVDFSLPGPETPVSGDTGVSHFQIGERGGHRDAAGSVLRVQQGIGSTCPSLCPLRQPVS